MGVRCRNEGLALNGAHPAPAAPAEPCGPRGPQSWRSGRRVVSPG